MTDPYPNDPHERAYRQYSFNAGYSAIFEQGYRTALAEAAQAITGSGIREWLLGWAGYTKDLHRENQDDPAVREFLLGKAGHAKDREPGQCPTCGMDGWDGVDLKRTNWSGCPTCGFCY